MARIGAGRGTWARTGLRPCTWSRTGTRTNAGTPAVPTGPINIAKRVFDLYMYRLRAGRFRVFFDLEQNEVKIYLIQEVKKRDERTY